MRATALSLLAMLSFAACAPGKPAEALRPAAPTVSGAMGEHGCVVREDESNPLIVDWKPDQRADLEVAMGDGVAVVEYNCNRLRLLPRCHAAGRYSYVGVSSKEEVLQLKNEDEIRASLPRSGVGLAAELSADFERGATLDVAMVLVGRKRADKLTVVDSGLMGECSGATHFVQSASIGAFATDNGTRAHVRAAAEIFAGGGAGAKSSSARVQHSKDGDIEACRKATPQDEKPPLQCGALLRLALVPLAKPQPAATPAPNPNPAPAPAPAPGPNPPAPGARPAPARQTTAAVCNGDHLDVCQAQCRSGVGRACCRLGAARNEAGDALGFFTLSKMACDNGDPYCCNNEASSLENGLGVAQNVNEAARLYWVSCEAGNELGCHNLVVLQNKRGDGARAVTQVKSSCARGNKAACEGIRTACPRGC